MIEPRPVGRIRTEGQRLLKFGLIGLTATAVHLGVLAGLIEGLGWGAIGANSLAFCAAFGVSFVGNYRWTFQAQTEKSVALRRFLITSLAGFGLNTAVLSLLVQGLSMDPLPSGMVAALLMPALVYVASRAWVFRDPGSVSR